RAASPYPASIRPGALVPERVEGPQDARDRVLAQAPGQVQAGELEQQGTHLAPRRTLLRALQPLRQPLHLFPPPQGTGAVGRRQPGDQLGPYRQHLHRLRIRDGHAALFQRRAPALDRLARIGRERRRLQLGTQRLAAGGVGRGIAVQQRAGGGDRIQFLARAERGGPGACRVPPRHQRVVALLERVLGAPGWTRALAVPAAAPAATRLALARRFRLRLQGAPALLQRLQVRLG